MLIPCAISLTSFDNNRGPLLSPVEAVAVSRHFLRSVDEDRGEVVRSVQLQKYATTTMSGAVRYLVSFDGKSRFDKWRVEVDANSGDVFFASSGGFADQSSVPSKAVADRWVKNLGRAKEVRYDAQFQRHTALVKGAPIGNINGDFFYSFRTSQGRCVWFIGFGKCPPDASHPIRISERAAILLVKQTRGSQFKNWPEPLGIQATQKLFYDEKAKSSRWVWEVCFGSSSRGQFREISRDYVDGDSGQLLPDDKFGSSSYRYQPRPPRTGLVGVSPALAKVPKYDQALAILREFGRSDFKFTDIELNRGIRLGKELDWNQLLLGPNGQLLAFRAPTPPGRLGKAKALKIGTALIQKYHPILPEGHFLTADSQMGNYTSVYYEQTAFGYPFLDSRVVSLDLNRNATLVSFEVSEPKKRPSGVPATIKTPMQIEQIAYRLALPHLQKDTANVHFFVKASAGKKGWVIDPATKQVRLVYAVAVMFMRDIKNYAVQGGGRSYFFDAETGKCLERFP